MTAPTPHQAAAQTEREKFEAMMRAEGYSTKMVGVETPECPRVYDDPRMHAAWFAYQAARRELLARQVPEWRPIETAPKDGTTVLVGRDMGSFGFVRGHARYVGEPGAFVSGWISHGFSEFTGNLGLAQPTHWMPLPAAPTAAGAEEVSNP